MALAYQAAASAKAAGAEGVEMPDLDKARAEFDAWLVSDPTPSDPQQHDLLMALRAG